MEDRLSHPRVGNITSVISSTILYPKAAAYVPQECADRTLELTVMDIDEP